jgi:hypothetical protein
MSLTLTLFRDYGATGKKQRTVTGDDLCTLIRDTSAPAKGELPWLKLARFGNSKTDKGSLRHDRNVIAITGVEADYDGGRITFDEAVETAEKAGLRAIIYTSPSHTPDRPRWRILCPTSREFAPDRRPQLLDRVNGLYRGIFAAESWTLSQSYYFGSVNRNPDHRVEIVDGQTIDELDELDQIAIGKPQTDPSRGNGTDRMSGPVDEKALLVQIYTAEAYHTPAMRLLGSWARQGVGLVEAERRLRSAFDDAFPLDRDDRWRSRVASIPEMLSYVYGKEAGAKETPLDGASGGGRGGSIQIYDAGDIDVTKIPPRGWLVGKTFCRKFISGLIGAGTAGKTTVRYSQYLAAATQRKLTGEHVHVRCRVLIVCLEDDLDEIRRRLGAAMLHHGVTPDEVVGWLYYCCPRGLKLLHASPRGEGVRIGDLYAEVWRLVAEHKIDIVSLDPFIKAAGVEENDNNLIDQVCTMLAGIGDEFDCAIDINSHARKGDAAPGDAERDRGASAKKDAGRLMRTITPMSTDEAALFGISAKDQPAFVRVDDAKVNIAPRSTEAMWFRLVGVPLGNGDETYPNGDHVQTAERWYPPDAFAKLDLATIERILNKIEAGPYDGGRYSPAANATDRAAWPVVQEYCPDFTEKQSRHVIKTWLRTGVLLKRDHKDPKDSHEHVSLFVGKRPVNTWEG